MCQQMQLHLVSQTKIIIYIVQMGPISNIKYSHREDLPRSEKPHKDMGEIPLIECQQPP